MFNIPRKVVYSQSLRNLAKNYRSVCSNRNSEFPIATSYNDATAKDSGKSEGYGEKEIFLLNPIDIRTPLPGNTGIAPMSMLFQDTIKPLPQSSGEKCDLIVAQLPEERHKNALTHLACIAVESVLSSSEMLECVAFECPQLLKKDFADLFPKNNLGLDNLTVLTLCQKTEHDMSQWNEEVELERSCLEKCFIIAAQGICSSFKDSGYWADFIHPTSGRPFIGSSVTNSTMLETDLRYRHFGFTIEDLGCCKVISHHLWDTHAFVGAVFTNAPLKSPEVKEIVEKHSSHSLNCI